MTTVTVVGVTSDIPPQKFWFAEVGINQPF